MGIDGLGDRFCHDFWSKICAKIFGLCGVFSPRLKPKAMDLAHLQLAKWELGCY